MRRPGAFIVSADDSRFDKKARASTNSSHPAEVRNAAFRRVLLSIPKGKVATYGQVAAAAGYPLHHRAVARFLSSEVTDRVPWQRVVGAGGEIKLRFEAAAEQLLRLRMEGVTFRGKRVNLELHQHLFGLIGKAARRNPEGRAAKSAIRAPSPATRNKPG
jgi:methylated-DNA-protein-cysteine methyltransferase related protein